MFKFPFYEKAMISKLLEINTLNIHVIVLGIVAQLSPADWVNTDLPGGKSFGVQQLPLFWTDLCL